MRLDRDFLDGQRGVPDPQADALVASVFEADPDATSLELIVDIPRR